MRVAGIRTTGAPVTLFEAPEPRRLADDEVLIEVMAAGVGNWDEFVRTGGGTLVASRRRRWVLRRRGRC